MPGVQVRAGDPEQLRPGRGHRQVRSPAAVLPMKRLAISAQDQVRLLAEQQRPGLDAVLR